MAFDDDDDPAAAAVPSRTNNGGPSTADDALDEDAPDMNLFVSMFAKAGVSSKAIRKGEKDFESHGTKAQENLLEASRKVMADVLGYTRIHREDSWVRGWCFPDWWADVVQAGEQDRMYLRDRVVVMEHERGSWQKDTGRTPGKMEKFGAGRLWLLPEEAIFLVERGTMDLWWPNRQLEEVLGKSDGTEDSPEIARGLDDYEIGLPLSLEAAYSLFIGLDGERGKISLPKYQVYSHLKRAGFHVLRAPTEPQSEETQTQPQSQTLWKWLISLVTPGARPRQKPFGPLVQPGLYRAYRPIYEQLALLPRHKPLPTPAVVHTLEDPYKVFWHVWKTGGPPFSKKSPPPPDFRIAVVEADDSFVPTLGQIEALLESTPYDPPNESWKGPGRTNQRLKHGHRNVLVAIVDRGLVNFMRFGEAAFGEEVLFERFDNTNGPRGGKKGGRGGGRGRGRGRGRGGRGRGGRR